MIPVVPAVTKEAEQSFSAHLSSCGLCYRTYRTARDGSTEVDEGALCLVGARLWSAVCAAPSPTPAQTGGRPLSRVDVISASEFEGATGIRCRGAGCPIPMTCSSAGDCTGSAYRVSGSPRAPELSGAVVVAHGALPAAEAPPEETAELPSSPSDRRLAIGALKASAEAARRSGLTLQGAQNVIARAWGGQ